MKTINDVYELLGVKPFYDSIISRQNNIISGNTKAVLKGNAQKLYDLTEKLASIIVNPMSQKTPLNFKQICDEFIWASAGGVDRIQQIFDRRKKVRELVYALFYNFRKEAEPDKVILLDSNLCSMVLELVKKHNNRAIRKALLYFLTEYWTDLPSKIKSSILTCLVVSTKGIEQLRKNAFDITLEKNLIWVRPDGAIKLAQNLMSRDISVANNFFSENRIPQNDSYDLPLFIPFDKRKSYCADVLKFMLETERQSGKMGSYIQLMFQYSNSGYFSRDDVLRLLVAAMVKNPQLSHKEELKNTALKRIGDTLNINQWFLWRNASLEDKTDIEAVRKIIDNWMREDILSIFFEKLVVNAERKNFWMKYVKSMDITRMFCNASDQNILRGDYRLQNEASYGRLENSKMAGQDAPVLVMQIRDMILVEVAAGGNALYIYRRHNLEKHGLTKFLKALNGEKTLPFRIGEFKETSLDRLGSYNDEGRFFHSADWQYKLTRWLNDNGIYSA